MTLMAAGPDVLGPVLLPLKAPEAAVFAARPVPFSAAESGPGPRFHGRAALARPELPRLASNWRYAAAYTAAAARGVNCLAYARPGAGSGRSPPRTRDSAAARAPGSSGGTRTPRPPPSVRARPSTAVPTTGTPSPRPSTALCDHDSSREGTTCTLEPAM